ncbi:MAG: hypothetical protein IPM38_15505 [Ignavibacteria bacterium]|nr:hypothetical protein [Ignavibacteria bacterium]
MIKSNFIEILRTFSKEELVLFEEFISTSFHNKNVIAVRLFSEIKKFHPSYNDSLLTKEYLFRKISGRTKYKDTYIRNLFSDLYNLAEIFIQYRMISKSNEYKKLLIEELKDRDLYELAEKKIKSFENEMKKIKAKDHEYYLNMSFIYEMKSFLLVDKTLTDSFRTEQISGIIKLFVITLMENSFYLRVEEQRVNIRHSFDFLKYVLEFIKDHLSDFEDSPLLMIYYYLWLHYFYDEEGDKNFLKAKEYFKKNFKSLSKTDKKNIYSVMQIYYINKIDRGETGYNKEYLGFLLEMLKLNVLSHKEKDFINLNLFRNILILCVMLKETELLKKFITKYIGYVDLQSRDTITAYSYSHLNFLLGDFEKALELCNKINYYDLLSSTNDNLYFKNDIRALTLKCLYELKYYENAISFIDTHKHFIRNSKLLNESPKKKYMNFLKFVSELIKLNLEFDEFSFKELKSNFISTKKLIQSDWISEKISELEKEFQKK